MATVDAVITNSTAVMLTSVAGDPAAIGYVSMGSLNETVKAVSVDGNAATVEGIKDGSYTPVSYTHLDVYKRQVDALHVAQVLQYRARVEVFRHPGEVFLRVDGRRHHQIGRAHV